MLPLSRDNNETLLIDLRRDSFGQVHFLPIVKKQVFGSAGYSWEDVGYVAPIFTDFIKELGTEQELKARYPGWEVLSSHGGQAAVFGGRGEIRTHGELAPTAVFKTAALNHSATLPSD